MDLPYSLSNKEYPPVTLSLQVKPMQTISLTKIQTAFPDIIAGIEVGEEILISSAETQKNVAVIVPYDAWQKTKPRVLGTLQNRGSVEFAEDFALTDEELFVS